VRRFAKSFPVTEVACKDGTPVPDVYYENATAICERAQKLRDLVGEPLQVLSGFRTPSHNKKVGGAAKSQHLTASALDLRCPPGWNADRLAGAYEALVRLGFVPDGGVGTYPTKGFVHIDLGPARRWREE
jgi:uncharacterized protein YcbK (DUF882 family)